MSDVLATPVDELEVSVKTAGFLADLGVATLGDLVALPRIDAPRLVAAELQMLFEMLEVEYGGELVVPPPPATEKAEGTLEERWKTITAYLEENHPSALARFRPGAKPAAIAAVENAVGHELPDDYKRFLAMHDGQEDLASMVEGCTLLPASKVAARYGALATLYKDAEPSEYSPAWIPIGVSARGRDILCLDVSAPGAEQVILLVIDDDERPVVARSFADLLSRYFEEIQTGEIDLDEDEAD